MEKKAYEGPKIVEMRGVSLIDDKPEHQASDEGLPREFAIISESGEEIGDLSIYVNEQDREVYVWNININKENQKKGYATLVYTRIKNAYPGYKFVSSGYMSEMGRKLWKSLTRIGLARLDPEKHRWEMI